MLYEVITLGDQQDLLGDAPAAKPALHPAGKAEPPPVEEEHADEQDEERAAIV